MGLSKKYKATEVESRWQQDWQERGLYRFDASAPGEVYAIDTPPPTVSGSLHIGHLFSYTQAEMIARYKRARGFNVFYPMGFDDNGLPTERLVEKEQEVRGSDMDREAFVELCLETTKKYGDEFTAFFQSLGFSFDWDLCYSTIAETSRRISQRSFLDLHAKGRVFRDRTPTIWCPQCETSYAQAEVESQELPSTFNQIPFRNDDGDEIVIATTRPELLPACVSLFVHPDDERYSGLVGKGFRVPLFGHEVTLRADHRADPEKGTGAVMCCTFGDKTDIEWWREHKLDLREALTSNGHMTDLAGEFAGMYLKKARKEILATLEDQGLLLQQEQIVHPVNVHERCGTEQEFRSTPQWYVRILDHKEAYLKAGEELTWWPSHMGKRYADWVRNLEWDWCVSRQRFFGVPIPVWNCRDCGSSVVASDEDLPVDPQKTPAPGPCPDCGSTNLSAETDVLDTWATSSVTPQINRLWREPGERAAVRLPMALRPQSHDIIRTWAFYTIVKAIEHEGSLPWTDVMVSGFVVDPAKKKISKSKSKNIESPPQIIERFGADLIRWWALGSKLGVDFSYFRDNEGRFSKENVDGGRRMVNKLWNASRFIEDRTASWGGSEGESQPVDVWIRSRCDQLTARVTDYLEAFEFGIARGEIEKFFFQDLCDNYLEMVKKRLYEDDASPSREAAQATLQHVLRRVLVLLAPYIPHVTEEIFHSFAFDGDRSVHSQSWPEAGEVDDAMLAAGELALELVSQIRRYKTENGLSMNAPLSSVTLGVPGDRRQDADMMSPVVADCCVVAAIRFEQADVVSLTAATAASRDEAV